MAYNKLGQSGGGVKVSVKVLLVLIANVEYLLYCNILPIDCNLYNIIIFIIIFQRFKNWLHISQLVYLSKKLTPKTKIMLN